MNTVCFAPVALLKNEATQPRARQWHASELGDGYVVIVIDFWDEDARDVFLAQPGVEPWPDLDVEPNAPLAAAAALRLASAKAIGAKMPTVGRPAIAALEDLRKAGWPMARRRF